MTPTERRAPSLEDLIGRRLEVYDRARAEYNEAMEHRWPHVAARNARTMRSGKGGLWSPAQAAAQLARRQAVQRRIWREGRIPGPGPVVLVELPL